MVTKSLGVAAGIILLSASWPGPSVAQSLPRVMIRTEVGSLEVEVDSINAPAAAGNFLRHVDHGAYQAGRFYRTVRAEKQPGGKAEIEVIQGGPSPSRANDFSPMALERKKDTGLSLGGETTSVSRRGVDAAEASDFFIRVGRQPELGRLEPGGLGFAVFGRVVRGSEVVRLIHTARAQDQRLTPPIGILDVTRVR